MPSPPNNCLPLTGSQTPDVDVEAPIRTAKSPVCVYYSDAYAHAAQDVESSDTALAKLYRTLSILCSFFPNYQDVAQPYRPLAILEGRRSAVPDDLSESDLDAVASLVALTKDPALRARLGDVLWVRRRDHKAAKQAVEDYIQAATRLLTSDNWVHSVKLFHRALQLADRLGRKNTPWKGAEKSLLDALAQPLTQSKPFYACHLLQIASQTGAGEPVDLARQASEQAEKAAKEKDHRREREYRLLEEGFHSISGNVEGEEKARLAGAETYIAEAEACFLRSQPSYLAASHFLAQGIEALRQARANAERVTQLRKRLSEYQQKSLSEMQSFRTEIDIRKPVEEAVKIVSHPDFRKALKHLAFACGLVDVKKLREEVLHLAEEFPESHIFGSSILDSAGRVMDKIGGILGAAGPEAEEEIEARMFQHAAQAQWSLRASGFIEPARLKVWLDHQPQPSDFAFLVRHNPFVPPGHEGIFMRGLFYGLAGDLLLASHLLTPQVENSIRFVLERNGVDVSNLESDLTQPVKILGPLFGLPEVKKIFGEDLCFELRGLLIEKTGYSFRNRVSHGFVTESECYGPAAINVWWLVLRLCYTPLARLEQHGPESPAPVAPPIPHDQG